MNTLGPFYVPAEVDYASVVPAYQEAFTEWPWNEASTCADDQMPQRCPGGMSAVEVGNTCTTCGLCPSNPAYGPDELVARFSEIGETRPALWYIEKQAGQVALAALCWQTDVAQLMYEKYQDVPAMEPWLREQLGTAPFVYLDEIFRDKRVRAAGNLANFGTMVAGFSDYFQNPIVAYRSKQPRLIAKTEAVFSSAASITRSEDGILPDWRKRSFVTIQTAMYNGAQI